MPPPTPADAAAARRAEALRVHDTSAMLLAFFSLAFPTAFSKSVHRPRRNDNPVNRLLPLLSDGVLLADILSLIVPTRLPPESVLRTIPRNARSVPVGGRPSDVKAVDVLYRANTRRTVSAVRSALEKVREEARPVLKAPPNVIDAFLGRVSDMSPTRDVRPALRLAELIVAAAVYGGGEDGQRYAQLFWQLPTNAARNSFVRSMKTVSHAVFLPMPDALYEKQEPEPEPEPEPTPNQVVELERNFQEEVVAAPIADDTLPAPIFDDGMGARKFSLVTDDEAVSRGTTSPPAVLEQPAGSASGDEFFTPREHSPMMHPTSHMEEGPSVQEQVDPQLLDENVRQSVSKSISQTIKPPDIQSDTKDNMSQDMSELDLDPIRTTNTSEQVYREHQHPPIDFCDPTNLISPPGSDAPAPSNQWRLTKPEPSATAVSSPQQLFSPPRMPRRLSRTATEKQMIPPPLFRSASPQISESSAGVRSTSDMEAPPILAKLSRVSFAETIISPGGGQRPLGNPQQTRENSSAHQFSFLPPSAAGPSSRTEPGSAVYQENTTASRPEIGTTSEIAELVINQEEEDQEVVIDNEEGEVATNESVSSEKPSFEEVEELLATKTDGTDRGRDSYEMGQSSQNTAYNSGFYSGEPSSQYTADRPEEEKGLSNQQEHVTDRALFQPINQTGVASASHALIGDQTTQDTSEVVQDDFDIDALYNEKTAMEALNYKPGLSPVGTPMPASPADRRMAIPANLQPPPTPPSPPSVAALVESITSRKHNSETVNARPVSTMAPSAGLFKKLIEVWQNTEETDHSRVSRQVSRGKNEATSHSTHGSTIPSGDVGAHFSKSKQSPPESPRSRRRRGMRIHPGSPTVHGISAMSDDSKNADDRGSVASFSDAFSSDKERSWLYGGRTAADGYDWEDAMRGDKTAGIPATGGMSVGSSHADGRKDSGASSRAHGRPPLPPASPRASGRKTRTTSTTSGRGVVSDGQHIKVDRRRLDWLTREVLAARDAISRQELQMTFAETQRMEQEEVLLLDKQNAESVVEAMKKIIADRESELQDARSRLSVAIQEVGTDTEQAVSTRAARSSATSVSGDVVNLRELMTAGHAKLHSRFEEAEQKRKTANEQMAKETRGLWTEIQRALLEKMSEMTEKRDAELAVLRAELERRQKIVDELEKSRAELRSKNDGMQSDLENLRLEKQKSSHRYQLEMAHVGAQVELVNEFSKKLHDHFRETENLRQQVLQYQDKLAHITSTSGVSQRQIKELREAVTRANDECARLRREADIAKRIGREAVRRAEELETLGQSSSINRLPDRQDQSQGSSFHSHDPVRPAGQNRPGGSGTATRYHMASRGRSPNGGPTPAQKAWLVIKDKIGGIVTGKEGNPSRRRPVGNSGRRGHHRSPSPQSAASHSSASRSRSRYSPQSSTREDAMGRPIRSPMRSRTSNESGSSVRTGPQRSTGSARRASPSSDRQYVHESPSPRSRGEVTRIRAVDF